MKKLLVMGMLLCAQSVLIQADPTLEERLEAAVSSAQTVEVNQFLRRLDKDSLEREQKKMLVGDLADLAQQVLEKKKSKVGFLNNSKDFAMGTLGALAGALGLLYFVHSGYVCYKNRDNHRWLKNLIQRKDAFLFHGGMSLAPACFGTYLAYKGLTCSTQHADIKQSRIVLNSLEDKKKELGL